MTAFPEVALFANPRARRLPSSPPDTAFAAPAMVRKVRRFHRTLPDYQPTPLHALAGLARHLGLGRAARILLFSTEGATDPESYRQAVAAPPGDVPCGP